MAIALLLITIIHQNKILAFITHCRIGKILNFWKLEAQILVIKELEFSRLMSPQTRKNCWAFWFLRNYINPQIIFSTNSKIHSITKLCGETRIEKNEHNTQLHCSRELERAWPTWGRPGLHRRLFQSDYFQTVWPANPSYTDWNEEANSWLSHKT